MVLRAAALILAASAACAQSFAVATIKPSRGGKGEAGLGATPGTLTIRNLPLRMIIGAAYGIADYQINGPQWLRQERFDIVAKADGAVAGQDEMLPLLQPLLADRFHLTSHRETRQLPAYVLTVAKGGPKLEPAADDAAPALPFKKANKSNGARIHSPHLTMAQFVEILSRRLGHPIRDMTGLSGAYRVTLEWADEKEKKLEKPGKPGRTKPAADRPSVFTALQDQTGLRLEAGKAPVEILVIDHIEKTPSAN